MTVAARVLAEAMAAVRAMSMAVVTAVVLAMVTATVMAVLMAMVVAKAMVVALTTMAGCNGRGKGNGGDNSCREGMFFWQRNTHLQYLKIYLSLNLIYRIE